MRRKVLIIPGKVMSKMDGQIHYIPAHRLAYLYCLGKGDDITIAHNEHDLLQIRKKDFDLICEPRYDGDYPVFSEDKK